MYTSKIMLIPDYIEEIDKMKKQQKAFIKYLEDMLDDENDIFSVACVKDVLQKYKEIIGNDINVGSKGENK